MVVKTPKDVEKLQVQIADQFERYVRATQPREGLKVPDQDPQLLVKEARASLEAAIRDRAEGLRMADLRIERRKSELASLESNLERVQREAAAAPSKRPAKPKKRAGDGG